MSDYRTQAMPSQRLSVRHNSSIPSHSRLKKAALAYAERGKPVFPCKPDKSPHYVRGVLEHGHHDATTDRSRINMLWSKFREAGIGMPTGERSGYWVLDVDDLAALGELERRHGKLPATLTVRTPSGGFHLYFRHAEGITNRTGALPEGIDIRGEGGYVLVPPSVSYSWVDRSPVAEAPDWLLELIRERRPAGIGTERRSGGLDLYGGPIQEGRRNSTLASICGRLHNGTRDEAELVADLMAINGERCVPPLPEVEVEKIARSIYRKEPCRPSGRRDPEVVEILEAAGLRWYEDYLPRSGRNKLRDVARAHLEAAAEYGRLATVELEGEPRLAVRYSEAMRDLRLRAKTSKASVSRYTNRLVQDGVIVRESGKRGDEHASTYLIVEPAPNLNTRINPSGLESMDAESFSLARPPRPDDLVTPCWPWRSLVGNARGGTLDALEAFGWQTVEELAERLGYARPRDLRRKHLEPLAGMGLVEHRDGKWSIVADYEEATRIVEGIRVETLRRSYSPSEGRTVTDVVEVPSVADWERRASRINDKERRDRREELARRSPEADDACRKVLNELDRELDRVAAADGLISELEPVDMYTRLSRSASGWRHAERHLESLGFDPAWMWDANPESELARPTEPREHGPKVADGASSTPPGRTEARSV